MTRKSLKNNHIVVVDPIQIHIDEAREQLLNDLMNKDAEFAGDVLSDKDYWAKRSVSDKVEDENKKLKEEAGDIGKKIKELQQEEAISGSW